MAICYCSEPAQCLHRALLAPERPYPRLQDRKRTKVPAGDGLLAEVASILCLTAPIVGAGILLYLRSLVVLWVAMHRVLVATGQDPDIASTAYAYILCSLPDLVVQSFLHPLRIYLRAQSVTLPLTYAAAAAVLLHVPINFVLVDVLGLGIRGVALGAVCTNLNFLLFIVAYVCFFGMYGHDEGETKASVTAAEEEGAKEWWSLINFQICNATPLGCGGSDDGVVVWYRHTDSILHPMLYGVW
ncbi:MATE efflux family protein 8 [Triticum urartu]|uniref:MATE efflux family protein 8 n=1 Tax=Triticum urartu TaxID=4572 RepID=M8ASL2_TRIUA|nr:MATE efflux family protein 8 [Triticum urartu]